MSERRTMKPNYNDPNYNHEYQNGNKQYENSYGEPVYLPANYEYDRNYTNSFYEENGGSGTGSFLLGALVGGVIGAAAALFLAPKSGSEMREDLTVQATQFKDKSIEISTVAKEKATEFTSVAKERTGEISKSIQEQSGQLVDKVKSMTSKTSVPMDDGTASSEGEEAIDFIDKVAGSAIGGEQVTSVGEALKNAVVETSNGNEDFSLDNQKITAYSDVSSNNSENLGIGTNTDQNYMSDNNKNKL
jgi:gas vesicle protein